MKATLSLTLLLAAVPVLAAGPAELRPTVDTAPAVEEPTAQLPAGSAWTWAVSDTNTTVAAALFQSDVDATDSCSAKTFCSDGSILSCSGQNLCFSDPCFVYCDGRFLWCNGVCP